MSLLLSYALKDLYGSEFHVVPESVGGFVAETQLGPLQRCKESVHVGPFRDVVDAAKHNHLT